MSADKITIPVMRQHFEDAVRGSPRLRHTTPLGVMEINGEFSHYMTPDTDTLWIGFALGMRKAEQLARREATHD